MKRDETTLTEWQRDYVIRELTAMRDSLGYEAAVMRGAGLGSETVDGKVDALQFAINTLKQSEPDFDLSAERELRDRLVAELLEEKAGGDSLEESLWNDAVYRCIEIVRGE